MTEDELLEFLCQRRDKDGNWEEATSYVDRVSPRLPNWPAELIVEWLHRHSGSLQRYVGLFEKLTFDRETWRTSLLPGRNSFYEPELFDAFSDFGAYLEDPPLWQAQYMDHHGTGNSPIVLLDNRNAVHERKDLRTPWHLLEGHRRLALLHGLNALGKCGNQHDVWVATIRCGPV